MSINQRIKEIRIKGGWTQDQFATLLEENQQSITDVETGKKKPSLKLLENIGIKLGISMDWLICNIGPMKKTGYTSTEVSESKTTDSNWMIEKMKLLEDNIQLRKRIDELEGKENGSGSNKPKLYT